MTDHETPLDETQVDAPKPSGVIVPPIPAYPNLRPKPFTKADGNNPPPTHGRPHGSLNRKTVIRRMMEQPALQKVTDHLRASGMGDDWQPTCIRDQVEAALMLKALGGDMQAINGIFDGEFGKMKETVDNLHTVKQMATVKVRDENGVVKPQTYKVGKPALPAPSMEEATDGDEG